MRAPTSSMPPPVPQQMAANASQPMPPQLAIQSLAPPLPNAGAWHAQTPMSAGMQPFPAQQQQMPYGYQQQQPQQPWGVAPMTPQRAASPTMQDAFGNPVYAQNGAGPVMRPSMPQVAGFGTPKKGGLKPWMLVVGALIVAGLAFAITRGLIGGHEPPPKPPATSK
jgi:hypothetical protein